jgi:hypothetical protein
MRILGPIVLAVVLAVASLQELEDYLAKGRVLWEDTQNLAERIL